MKQPIIPLALIAAGLTAALISVTRQDSALSQQLLEVPFREYAALHDANLKYGQTAPELEARDSQGHLIRLSALCRSANLTLVTGADPGQGTSIEQLAELREAYFDLHDRGLAVAALVSGPPYRAGALRRELGLPFPVLADPGGAVLRRFGATGEPYAFLLRPDMRVIFVQDGRVETLGANQIVDRARSALTGTRAVRTVRTTPATGRLDARRPYIVDDLTGNPIGLPLAGPSVIAVFSPHCATCPMMYDLTAAAWKESGKEVVLLVVIAGDAASATKWLTPERRHAVVGARFFADPADLLRKRIGSRSYGDAVPIDAHGAAGRITGTSERDYMARLARVFSGKGGERPR